jgi:hypothetical protein
VDAVVAALPPISKAALRQACRAGRAAVDARVRRLVVPLGRAATLPATLPRLTRLEWLEVTVRDPHACHSIHDALERAPPSLVGLRIDVARRALYLPKEEWLVAFGCLVAGLGSSSGLEEVELKASGRGAACRELVTVLGRLPRLSSLRLDVDPSDRRSPPPSAWERGPPALELPWQLVRVRFGVVVPWVAARLARC